MQTTTLCADLHFHSYYSDGWESPTRMAERAAAAGVQLAALTDHDSMEGVEEFLAACHRLGMEGVAACEVDCTIREIGFDMELLAYFPRGNWGTIRAYLAGRLGEREADTRRMIAAAARIFARSDLDFTDFLRHRLGALPDKPMKIAYIKFNIYQYLRDRAVLDPNLDYRDFRREYLTEERLGQPRENKPDGEELLALVREAGGQVVLPHPAWVIEDFHSDQTAAYLAGRIEELRRVLAWCRRHGVWGVELNHYWEETQAINRIIAEEAARFGFPLTPGSDDHGRGSTHVTLEKHRELGYGFAGFPER